MATDQMCHLPWDCSFAQGDGHDLAEQTVCLHRLDVVHNAFDFCFWHQVVFRDAVVGGIPHRRHHRILGLRHLMMKRR